MHNDQIIHATQREAVDRRWDWIAVIGIMLIATALRVLALNDVPPGLHHDEVIIGQVAKDILRGHLAIYFTAGYGHEPLYHYTLAGMFALIGANAFVLRLTSAFIALLGLAMTYRFIRLIFSPLIALGTLAWMAVSLWPVFFSRVGLRGILLPLMSTMTAYFLWKAIEGRGATPLRSASGVLRGGEEQPHSATLRGRFAGAGGKGQGVRYFALAGGLLGLTLYTYQASRIFPLVFGLFFVYLFITRHSSLVTRHSLLVTHHSHLPPAPRTARGVPAVPGFRSILVFFLAAAIVAAPLIAYLTLINPTAEQRIAELSGPLDKLVRGDASEVIQSTLNTLGMFTIRGDAVPIYNVGGRPVFPEPIGAALFYIGLLVCAWRWKQPAYALTLIWFFISLIPAMVTPFSPNFVRTIGAWPAPFVFVGIGMVSIGQLVKWAIGRLGDRSTGQSGNRHPVILSSSHLVIGIFGLILIFNGFLTARDYFVEWPTGDYVRFWQQASWTQAVRAINADPSTAPVVAAGLSIQDFDPQTFDLLGVRSDVQVKWADCRQAILYPGPLEQRVYRYLSPPYFACDADLRSTYLPGITTVLQPHWPDTQDVVFTLDQFERPYTQAELVLPRIKEPAVYLGTESFDPTNPTKDLQPFTSNNLGGLVFYGTTVSQTTLKPSASLYLDTFWMVLRPIGPPLKIFVHVTAPDGRIVTQWDDLGVNIATLEPGDFFIQRHHLQLPADLPSGPYRISIGAYHPDTGVRLTAAVDGRTIDAFVLGTIEVK